MISTADMTLEQLEARGNARRCRGAFWGQRPCQLNGVCPFGRELPQRPSDAHCEDVTPEMWEEVLTKKEAKHEAKV